LKKSNVTLKITGNNAVTIFLPKQVDESFLRLLRFPLEQGPLINPKRYTFSRRWRLTVKFRTPTGRRVPDDKIPWSLLHLLSLYFPVIIFDGRVISNII
jgi:hypothetical protein